MTLEEAKEFYFQYKGYSFHMDREESAKYNSYRELGLGEEVLKEWDEELMGGLFDRMKADPDRAWAAHGDILQIIGRQHCDTEKYLTRLLEEMENMDHLSTGVMTLIIENMAGRTEPMKDGGVYVYRDHPILAERMNAVMERLIAAYTVDKEAGKRFQDAVRRYRKAYAKWRTA